MRTRNFLLFASLLLAPGCAVGVDAPDLPQLSDSESAVTCTLRTSGQILGLGDPVAQAHVLAYAADGKLTGRAVTDAQGYYHLVSCAEPAELRVKAPNRVPRAFPRPELLEGGPGEWEFNAELGPWLGADGTGRVQTFLVRNTAYDVQVVPQVAWGAAGIGSPFEEVWDLTVGARVPQLMSLLPPGTRPAPALEDSVTLRTGAAGDYLELRLSEEANGVAYGSGYEAAYISQLVSTTCLAWSDTVRLPVKILVQCPSCASGWEPLRDAHVGPTGPDETYACTMGRPQETFPDLAGHRFAREIAMARGLKIAWGAGDGNFRPDDPVTRAEIVSMLVTALGLTPEKPCSSPYPDVASTSWYCGAVEAARAKGLTSGLGDGTYRPGGSVTRAELAAYIDKAAGWPLYKPATATFGDVSKGYWAWAKVETAHAWCRAMEPREPGGTQFLPASKATRGEAAAAVMRMLECLAGDQIRP
ncbi:MAG TPA: S-layer homology domain-containing protein [Polyangiaceae bacterium]|nr:S-layer homology domain-containing protein [Polyangiaceae bacterium]